MRLMYFIVDCSVKNVITDSTSPTPAPTLTRTSTLTLGFANLSPVGCLHSKNNRRNLGRIRSSNKR